MEEMVVQLLALSETWSWKALAYAVSQVSATWQICWLEPRSTWSHCGSLNALDQRVAVLPSTALPAGKVAFSVEDAVAGWFSAALAVAQVVVRLKAPTTGNSSSECRSGVRGRVRFGRRS